MSRMSMRRINQLDETAGDPLDGLVNLFDLGIVLAVAFLVVGLGLSNVGDDLKKPAKPQPQQQSQSSGGKQFAVPNAAPKASGNGKAVGRVYKLSNGQLVYVEE